MLRRIYRWLTTIMESTKENEDEPDTESEYDEEPDDEPPVINIYKYFYIVRR